MKATVFAKKGFTKDAKTFYRFISRLQKKDGTEITATVKFREDCGAPKPEECPLNIEFTKEDANLAKKNVTTEDGRELDVYTLWLSGWSRSAEKYEDHSLDDFE